MKKVILIFITAIILSSYVEEKSYSFKLKEGEVVMLYNTLQFSKQAIQTSDVKMKDGIQFINNIDSLSKIIITQYNTQTDTTKK